jgi:hypothetical protein
MIQYQIQRIVYVKNPVILSALIFIAFSMLNAQSREMREIKNDTAYLWGESSAPRQHEAEQSALRRLLEKISVQITSDQSYTVTADSKTAEEEFTQVMKTYSHARLTNVKYVVASSSRSDVHVLAYIKKSDLAAVFSEREDMVRSYFRRARSYARNGNAGNALKFYYYSIILMNSIPTASIDFEEYDLRSEIPQRIQRLLSGVSFRLISDEMVRDNERRISFEVSVEDSPVHNLSFFYWDGQQQYRGTVTDGVGLIRLYGSSVNFEDIDIDVDYEYYTQRRQIREIGELWELVSKPSFRSGHTLDLTEETEVVVTVGDLPLAVPKECDVGAAIAQNTQRCIDRIADTAGADFEEYDTYLRTRLEDIVRYTQLSSVPVQEDSLRIYPTYDGWELRRIPVQVSYPDIRQGGLEYLVLDFDSSGALFDVSFAVRDTFFNEVQEMSSYMGDWKERHVLVRFLEKYRTAFMARDIDALESIFSDDAVIIIGRITEESRREAPPVSDGGYVQLADNQPTFAQTQYTKTQYLNNQRRIFERQHSIDITFSSFNILRSNKQDGVYGISLQQEYTSTTYADEGYLFLLVNFNRDDPQIHVRTWQPREWDQDLLIDMANFRIFH